MRTIGKIVKYLILSSLTLIILGLISLGLIAWFVPPEVILQRVADFGLNWYGITTRSGKITRVTSSQLVIENLGLGDPQNFAIKKITLNYHPKDLLAGKIDEIKIDSLNANGQVVDEKNNKFSFGNIDKILKQNSESNSTDKSVPITYDNICIEHSNVILHKGNQKVVIPFSFHNGSHSNNPQNKKHYNSKFEFTNAQVNVDNFELPGVARVTLSSQLSGDVPYFSKEGNIIIHEGELFSLKNGSIKIVPYQQSSDEQTNLLYNLFSDFQYKTVNAKINMDENQVIHFNFAFDGNNKKFYDGKRVKLNVNLNIEAQDLIKYMKFMLNLEGNLSTTE